MSETCQHIKAVEELKTAKAYVCEECVKTGSTWLHLRTCQTCGITLCCNSSPHQHMTQHFHQSHHTVVSSAEPGEQWLWCYEDELFARY